MVLMSFTFLFFFLQTASHYLNAARLMNSIIAKVNREITNFQFLVKIKQIELFLFSDIAIGHVQQFSFLLFLYREKNILKNSTSSNQYN